ncbi:MAG: hypothetical protein ACTSWD_12060 [Candidatus Heimdallarchaeota archaeon]
MKLNKVIIVTLLLLVVSPIVAVFGSTVPETVTVSPQNYGDGIGVVAGDTIKYTINELTLPDMDNLSLSNMVGNKLYIKVLAVADHEFPDEVAGDLIYYSLGIIFTTDVTLTIGEGITAFPFVIPAGSATPGITMTGVPHFNVTEGYSPSLFFLDDGWSFTNVALASAGLVVTEDLDTLNAAGTGIELEWRKSDGILTYLYLDDVVTPFGDFTGITVDISLESKEFKGVSLTVGQEITLQADVANLDITVDGDIGTLLNESTITSIEDEINVIEGNPFVTYEILAVEGLYYEASVSTYDFVTHSLVEANDTYVFNAFLGNIPTGESPIYASKGIATVDFPVYAPIITNDWDIFGGYMVLLHDIVDVYLDQVLDLLLDIPQVTFNNIEGVFQLLEKDGYRYMQEEINIDLDATISDITLMSRSNFVPQATLSLEVGIILQEIGWLAYSSTGVIAGARTQINLDASVELEGTSYGTIGVNFDFKLRNPDYNPPDPISSGLIPGFTWLVAIPALIGAAAVGLIIRRRK